MPKGRRERMGRQWKERGLFIRAVQTQNAFISASTDLETHSALSIETSVGMDAVTCT